MNKISFKEYLRLIEFDMASDINNPVVANADNQIKRNIQNLAQNNQNAPASKIFNQGAVQAVTKGNVQPGAAIQALNTKMPGQQTKPLMMNKKMAKKMRKK